MSRKRQVLVSTALNIETKLLKIYKSFLRLIIISVPTFFSSSIVETTIRDEHTVAKTYGVETEWE